MQQCQVTAHISALAGQETEESGYHGQALLNLIAIMQMLALQLLAYAL
jgi:hypothetical protein